MDKGNMVPADFAEGMFLVYGAALSRLLWGYRGKGRLHRRSG